MNNFICDKCGPAEEVYFDGYGFGERQLEGVKFVLNIQGEVCSFNYWDTDPYLSSLNKDYWLPRAKQFIRGYDVATCCKCGQDIYCEDEEGFKVKE